MQSNPEGAAVSTRLAVAGMSCDHCVRAVTEELGLVPGVTGVDVDLDTGTVDVRSDLPIESDVLRGAIVEAGYEVVG